MAATTDVRRDSHACDPSFPGLQVVRLVRRAIERTRLDLTGLRVLTEASVGYRRITPVIAALAGADAVFAVGRDSAQASRRQAEEQTAYLAALARVDDRIKLLSTRLQAPLDTIDVVTDLPGVRPVDESILRTLGESAAVTLMRGTEHWSATDVDVATCRRRSIAVAGVDEEAVGLYRYLPLEILAGLLDLGVEVAGSTLVVAGGGAGYAYVVQALGRLGGRVLVAAPETAGRIELFGGERIGQTLGDESVIGRLAEADALVLCPGPSGARWVGPGALVDAARLAAAAPHLAVAGSGAEADVRALASAGLRCRPAGDTPDLFDLLPQPLVALHTAGLKVGEVLARARRRGSSPLAAEQLAATEAHAEQLPKDLGGRRR